MKRHIIDRVKDSITKHSMISAGDRILAGLSGGADSVCLLNILDHLKNALGVELSAAYIDHGFRPDETAAEIEFCSKLCSERNIAFSTSENQCQSICRQ